MRLRACPRWLGDALCICAQRPARGRILPAAMPMTGDTAQVVLV